MFTPLTRSLDKEICETMCIASELCCYSPSSISEQISQTTDVYSLLSFVLRIPSPGLPEVGTNVRARVVICRSLSLTLQCGQSWLDLCNTGLRLSWQSWCGDNFHAASFLLLLIFFWIDRAWVGHLYPDSALSFKIWSKNTGLWGRSAGGLTQRNGPRSSELLREQSKPL